MAVTRPPGRLLLVIGLVVGAREEKFERTMTWREWLNVWCSDDWEWDQ
jgi:hypothetical protein